MSDAARWAAEEPYIGAQLRVDRGDYFHHGICAGEDLVVHFAGEEGDCLDRASEVRVRACTLAHFAQGGNIEMRKYGLRERLELKKPQEIADAALARVGEGGYDVLRNNCEDFSNECAFGKRREGQVDEYRRRVRELLNGGK